MATFATTIDIGDDVQKAVGDLLQRFPIGRRVRVEVTEEEEAPEQTPGLAEYRALVAAAREAAPKSPWKTTEEALREIRETEDR